MQFELLKEVVVILGLSVGILLLFRKFKLPGVLGFIVTGIIAGPHALAWVGEVEKVQALAELGVVFLLFVIGMEFSLKKLASLGATVFIGGTLQAGLVIGASALVGQLFGLSLPSAVFMGFLFALSSTAIVLRMLQEKGQMDSPYGRTAAAILIYQDILVVPMMLLTPLLAGRSHDVGGDLLALLFKMVLLLVVVYVSGRFLIPRFLDSIAKGKSKELFIITIVVICFSAAYATSAMGLSLALGAFFAGLIISESDQAHQATGIILPFHELFMSFFFVSIGMLVDPVLFLHHPLAVIGITVLVIVIKTIAAFLAVWLLRHPVNTALKSGLALFQVGEFAFVLAVSGMQLGLLTESHYQIFLMVSILTMGATPFAIAYADDISRKIFSAFLPPGTAERLDRLMRVRREQQRSERRVMRDHVVIIGFGLNGQNLARAAQSARIRCAVIEEDPDLARLATERGLHVVHGDASNDHVLEQAQVGAARTVVIAVSDHVATSRIVSSVRSHSSTAYLIVRTRYVHEMEQNLKAGANEVIPEEFETSIGIFHRVLRQYLVPESRIQETIAQIRNDHYGMFRRTTPTLPGPDLPSPVIEGIEIAALQVNTGRSRIIGHSFADIALRDRFGVNVLAVRRGNRTITQLDDTFRIHQDDILYLLGSPDGIVKLDRELR